MPEDLWHPADREAPKDVVRALKAIEPSVALVWLRRGVWLLGTVHERSDRRTEAFNALEKLYAAGKAMNTCQSRKIYRIAMQVWGDKVALWRLKYQGFLQQQTFACGDSELPGLAERWLREATWVRQHCYEETWNKLEAELERDSLLEQKEAEVVNRARLKDAWRMEFKRPVSRPVDIAFDSNGVRLSA